MMGTKLFTLPSKEDLMMASEPSKKPEYLWVKNTVSFTISEDECRRLEEAFTMPIEEIVSRI